MSRVPLSHIGCFLFDLDGTVYLGGQLLPGAKAILSYLEDQHLPFYFVTNNSSRSRKDYVLKLMRLGLTYPENKILSSGVATALYLHQQKEGARLYVSGTPSLEQEFRDFGFDLVQQQPDFAVLGFDTTLTYDKIRRLCDYIKAGVPYIATHPDINCPTEDGYIPDIGAMMAMIKASTGRDPDVIIGKPHLPMILAAQQMTGYPVDQIAMIGDRLYTDIAMGQAGITTVLVLSGESKATDLVAPPFQPDYVFENLAGLLEAMQRTQSH